MNRDTWSRSVSTTLLVRLKNKEEEAFQRLHDLFIQTVSTRLRRLGVSNDDVPDVAQEVFSRVFKGVDGFNRDGKAASFRRWLLTITRNSANDYHRRDKPERLGTDQLQQVPDLIPESEETEEIALEVHRMLETIQRDFTPESYEAFVRFWLRGEDTAKIAADLNKSQSAIRESRRRVLRRLREIYFDVYGASDWPFR